MEITTILEHHISLQIFDTQLGAQGMEDICEIWHYLVSFLPQCGPFGIQVIITSDRVVLFLNIIPEGFQVVVTENNEVSFVSFCS
jgi:hypothetical protein